jgi:hypothetical protein
MFFKDTAIRATALLVVGCAPAVVIAQPGAAEGPRAASDAENVAALLNPPGAANVELSEARRVPAEQRVAAYGSRNWRAPKTSWGHPSLAGTWTTDDMRGIPFDRPAELGTQESLSQEQFLARARMQQSGRDRAATEETFLRNEWGTRTFGFTSLVVDPPNGRMPALTDAGRARAAGAGRSTFGPGPWNTFEDFSLYDRCIARGLSSGTGAVLYGNGIRIVQGPGAVSITYEMIHETRIIPLDGRAHLERDIQQYTGNGRGRWDGDTLVVESSGFTDRTSIGFGAPHSASVRTTEHIRRVDPEMIEYRITVDDPETYAAPFTIRTMWTTQPSYELYEYSCHEGNGAVRNALSGERAYERQVEEARAKGLPPPRRGTMMEVHSAPPESAEVFNINRGE